MNIERDKRIAEALGVKWCNKDYGTLRTLESFHYDNPDFSTFDGMGLILKVGPKVKMLRRPDGEFVAWRDFTTWLYRSTLTWMDFTEFLGLFQNAGYLADKFDQFLRREV